MVQGSTDPVGAPWTGLVCLAPLFPSSRSEGPGVGGDTVSDPPPVVGLVQLNSHRATDDTPSPDQPPVDHHRPHIPRRHTPLSHSVAIRETWFGLKI
jgi:hypothetical protein